MICFCTGTPSRKLTPRVMVVVLGFFSPDDKMTDDHFHFEPQERKCNYVSGTERDLFTFLITHFCAPESTVLDISGLAGTNYLLHILSPVDAYASSHIPVICILCLFVGAVCPVAALQAGRNAVCVVDNDDVFSTVIGKLSDLPLPEVVRYRITVSSYVHDIPHG